MGQFIFFALFCMTLLAGIFAYFAPSQKPLDPMKFVMVGSGFTSVEDYNRKRTQNLNMQTNKGLIQVRREMENLALQQNKFLDSLRDQQEVLKNTSREAADLMSMSQQEGEKGGNDILQLKALAAEMQDQQRLMVSRGQDLLALNDQVTKNRQWISDQIDLANINNDSGMQMFQRRYDMLKNQVAGFFDTVDEHNNHVRDQMTKMQDKLNDLANNSAYDSSVQQQNAKEHMQRMLDKEHEDMLKLADSEERTRNLIKDAQQNFADSKEMFNDSLDRTQQLIEDQRQKEKDQQWINQQRMADQLQHMQDLQAQEHR